MFSMFMVCTVTVFLSVLRQVVLFFVSPHHSHRVTLCDAGVLRNWLCSIGKYHGIASTDRPAPNSAEALLLVSDQFPDPEVCFLSAPSPKFWVREKLAHGMLIHYIQISFLFTIAEILLSRKMGCGWTRVNLSSYSCCRISYWIICYDNDCVVTLVLWTGYSEQL